MIAKLYSESTGNEGWHFVDHVEKVHVDKTNWCVIRREDIVETVTVSAETNEPDFRSHSADPSGHVLANLAGMEYWNDNEVQERTHWRRVKSIRLRLQSGSVETYFVDFDGVNFLLSDQGKTIERI